jgi:hypothetical protein
MSRVRDIANILSTNTDMATDAEVTSSIASHTSAADPHSVYLKESEFNAAGKNYIINGAFDFWQRGTTFTTSGAFCADRWVATIDTPTAGTITQQTTSLPTGFRYSIRCQRNSGNTGTPALGISQAIESSISIPAQGKTVTFSYWAKAGANYSNSGSVLNVRINSGTGIDQPGGGPQFGGWTGYAETAPDQVITTTWTRYQATYNVPANATQLGVRFFMSGSGTAGTNDWFEITGVQLEIASIATPFSRAGGTMQGELASCQRYYQVLGDNIYELIYGGYMTSGTTGYISFPYPVTMRTTPTGTLVGGWAVFNTGQPIIQSTHPKTISLRVASTTTGQFYFHSNTTYYLTMNAEL